MKKVCISTYILNKSSLQQALKRVTAPNTSKAIGAKPIGYIITWTFFSSHDAPSWLPEGSAGAREPDRTGNEGKANLFLRAYSEVHTCTLTSRLMGVKNTCSSFLMLFVHQLLTLSTPPLHPSIQNNPTYLNSMATPRSSPPPLLLLLRGVKNKTLLSVT